VYPSITHKKRGVVHKTEAKQCLMKVTSTDKPTLEYEWEDAGKNELGHKHEIFRIKMRKLPANRHLQICYNSDNTVSELKAPIGLDEKLLTTYRFKYTVNDSYKKIKTEVYDAGNQKTVYDYPDNNRLRAITRYRGNSSYELYLKERFRWGKAETSNCGWLIANWIEECHGWIQKCTTYDYDNKGNVVKETLFGNLTGNNEIPVIIDHQTELPIINGCENVSTFRTYSQCGLNLLLSETLGEKTFEFTYYPKTNLIKEKYTLIKGEIKQREFYSYDDDKVLIKKIVDDGSNRGSEDLTGITERKMTLITPSKSPVVGFPEIVEEYFIQDGRNLLLSKKVNTFNIDGKVTSEQVYDANGCFAYQNLWDYDAHGNLIRKVDAFGQETSYQYDANDNLIKLQGPDTSYYQTYDYDFSNRLIAEKLHTLNGTTYAKRFGYDLLGNKIWESDIYDNRTHFVYDELNRPIKVTYPDGTSTYTEYDVLNNPTRYVDENGHITTKRYTIRNQVAEIGFPDGSRENYLYNILGYLVEKIERNGTRVCYSNDGFGRVLKEERFSANGILLNTKSNTYNSTNILSETDASGITTFYHYDGASRLIRKVKGDIESHYEYDSLGRLFKTIEGSRVTMDRKFKPWIE